MLAPGRLMIVTCYAMRYCTVLCYLVCYICRSVKLDALVVSCDNNSLCVMLLNLLLVCFICMFMK